MNNTPKSDYLLRHKNKRYGRLVLVDFSHYDHLKNPHWLCKCDCGNEKIISLEGIKYQGTDSCGCYTKEKTAKNLSLQYTDCNFTIAYHKYTSRAKHDKIDFELNKDQFREITQKNCYYCNSEPKKITRQRKYHIPYIQSGIDRIDNDIGYIYNNCVPCCMICNQMKMDRSLNDFYNQVEKIFNLRVKNENN